MKPLLPITGWLPQYERSWLRQDLTAGITRHFSLAQLLNDDRLRLEAARSV
jgi:hypothetical protein